MGLYILRIYNVLFFSLFTVFVSFLPVYLNAKGLNKTEVGFVLGTGGLIGIFSQFLWAVISDRWKTIKKVMIFLLVISTGLGAGLYQAENFLVLLVLTGMMYLFFLPLDPLTESLNVQSAARAGVSFGSIRTFGSAGYAFMSLATGYVMKFYGAESLASLFVVVGILSLVAISLTKDATSTEKTVSINRLMAFLRDRKTLWFLILLFITAIPHRMNDLYLGVFITSLGGDESQVGLGWFVTAGAEIIVFALSFLWLRRGNELFLIQLALVIYCLRFAATVWMTDSQMIVWFQFLQALTFVFFYSASIQYLFRLVPEDWRATGQSVLGITFFGISGVVASYLGGWVFENYGGATLYGLMSVLSGFAWIVSIYFRRFIHSS